VKVVVETPAAVVDQGPALGLAAVVARWPEVVEWVGGRNRNVRNWLTSAEVLAVEGEAVIIGFAEKVAFLRPKFDRDAQARPLLEEALATLLGRPCRLRTTITEDYRAEHAAYTVSLDDFKGFADEVGGVVREG
jgi:hypothetical protein